MQPPQRERGVAHPAVAVVPVALAVGSLRERGGGGRDERSGGHERQPLQRQRGALQVEAPGMVGIGAFGQPRAPEVSRALHVFLGLLDGVRAAAPLRPGERAEALLAFAHRVASVRAIALDAHANVAEQPERCHLVGRVHHAHALLAGLHDAPARRGGAVVEHRLADDLDLHLALDAFDDAHHQVVGVVVGGRARVARAVLVVVPRADRERLHHAQPALRGHPGRLDDVRARYVAPPRRHVDAVRADPPAARAAVEHRAEDRRRVEVRQAHPLDRSVGGDQRARVAVREEAVVGDRRERGVDRGGTRAFARARRAARPHRRRRGRGTLTTRSVRSAAAPRPRAGSALPRACPDARRASLWPAGAAARTPPARPRPAAPGSCACLRPAR